MSHLRPDDLEMRFEVSALGTVPLGQTANIDLAALQKHLRELYLAYYRPTGAQALPQCCLVVSNKGLAVTDAPSNSTGRLPTAETLYNIPSVSFAAAVKFVLTGKKERDFKCAFEAIDSESPTTPKGKNDLYVALDKKWKHLPKVTSHPAICACVIQRMTGVRASELHAFVCQSDDQARDIIYGLTNASRNFTQRENHAPVYNQSPYDLSRPAVAPNGGLDNIQYHQRPSNESVGFQGYQDQGQPLGYRGPDVARSNQVSEGPQGPGRVNHQKEQLIRNFQEDQRREQMRGAPEQGIYDMQQQQRGIYDMPQQQRGIYDMPPQQKGIYDMPPQQKGIYDMPPQQKGIYDMPPQQKGIYDMPPQQKGIYDMQQPKSSILDLQQSKGMYEQPSIYEYKPQQPPQTEIPRNVAPEPVYGGQQRGIYDPPVASKGGSLGSTDRLFEDPGRGPDGSKGFAIPRFKVNYESGQSEAPGKSQGPADYESSPFEQTAHDPTLEKKAKKSQPPPPAAKSRQPSATSPTTEAAPRGPMLSGSHVQEPQMSSAPAEKMATARKVAGIKVFPTIMLRGAQAQAAAQSAAAAADGDDDDRRCNSSEQPSKATLENLRTLDRQQAQKKPSLEQLETEKSKKDREIETALGGLTVEPGKDPRSSQDFEYSLGYLP